MLIITPPKKEQRGVLILKAGIMGFFLLPLLNFLKGAVIKK
jgi:hypothetical protein